MTVITTCIQAAVLAAAMLTFTAKAANSPASSAPEALSFDRQLTRSLERVEVMRDMDGGKFNAFSRLLTQLELLTTEAKKTGNTGHPGLLAYGKQLLAYAEGHQNDPEFQHAVFHSSLSLLGGVLLAREDQQRFSTLTNHIDRAQLPRCLAEAKAGKAYAQIDLGYIYHDGRFGTPRDFREAARWFRQAAEQGSSIGAMNLGGMYERGEGAEQSFSHAAQWYRRGAAHGSSAQRNHLAWFLATCPDASQRNGAEAIRIAEKVVRETGRKEPNFLDTLAAAYAETGRFADAARTQREAIALLRDAAKKTDFQSRLDLFEAESAYHQPLGENRFEGLQLEEPER